MSGVLSVELSTIRICPVTPARTRPSLHQSTTTQTVISSFKEGTTMLSSTGPGRVPGGVRCSTDVVPSAIVQFHDHRLHRISDCFSRRTPGLPTQLRNLRAVKANDWNITL